MRIWFFALLAIVVGFLVGAGIAARQIGIFREVSLPAPESFSSSPATSKAPAVASAAGRPKVVVDQEVYDFGTMDARSEKKHDFVISNKGNAPLTIENKGTTCKCAISDFKTRTINPGQSTKITLTWTARDFFGPFEQQAAIGTNDPDRPKLVVKVKGRVTAPLRASPPTVVFSDIAAGQSAQTTVRVFAYKSDKLELVKLHLQDATTAQLFEITPKPLSAEEIAQEQDARSGYMLDVLVKPGLPLGRFQQTILVDTNLPKNSQLEIPIKGKIGSDITIIGRDWNQETQTLRLGVLPSGEGADRTLFLRVRGRYRRAIDFEVAEVFPPGVLSAELGKEASVNGGIAVRIPLTIHISKQAGPASYLGSRQGPAGHVILHTNHPQVSQIKIRVSFAIEGE